MKHQEKEPEVIIVEASALDKIATSIKGWPAVLWGLILGTGTFTILILGFINTQISTRVQASEVKVFDYLQGRKEVRDAQYNGIREDLVDLKRSNEKIIDLLTKNKP